MSWSRNEIIIKMLPTKLTVSSAARAYDLPENLGVVVDVLTNKGFILVNPDNRVIERSKNIGECPNVAKLGLYGSSQLQAQFWNKVQQNH